jgi:rhamnosyltransferase
MSGDKKQYLSDGSKYWGQNREQVQKIRKVLGIDATIRYDLGFFAGSMFWFNPKALEPLGQIGFGLRNKFKFDAEEGQRDGTLAHSIERVFADICVARGYIVSDVKNPNSPLDHASTSSNSIIVQ